MALLGIIRRWHIRDQIPLREIARRLGISRNTVRRYLRSEATEPSYADRRSPSAIDKYAFQLSGLLKTEAAKSRKQRRTLKQLHEELRELGFEGSYDRVAAFARVWRAGQTDRVNSASKRTLSQETLLESIDSVAILASSLDLHVRWLSQSSLRRFLSAGLKDTGLAKLRFLDSYWYYRKELLKELDTTYPPFVHFFTIENRPAYWRHWEQTDVAVHVQWRMPSGQLQVPPTPLQSNTSETRKLDYRHLWRRAEISDFNVHLQLVSPNFATADGKS